jgi:hypothetical protein
MSRVLNNRLLNCASFFFAGAVALLPARVAALTLSAVADTTLIEQAPNNNLGAQTFVNVGATGSLKRNRALFRFDPRAEIPTGSRITSAKFIVLVVGEPNEPPIPSNFNIYRVLKPWTEGTNGLISGPGQGQGVRATVGEATWNDRMALTTNAWAVPGAASGVDFSAQASSSQYVYGVISPPYVFDTSSSMVSDVQGWLDTPGSNFGWILICESELEAYTARRFGSREAGVDAPQLVVEFIPPLHMVSPQNSSNRVELSFTAGPEQSYSLQSANSLSSPIWNVETNFPPSEVMTNQTVSVVMTNSQQFYRLQSP